MSPAAGAQRDELVKKIVEFCPESVAKWTVDTFGVEAFGKKGGKNRAFDDVDKLLKRLKTMKQSRTLEVV